ncbi:bifunctional 3-demethylubiquinol 3-O-methyltransferase/2-polyprenyl-6-hydroxyphenol methylase [Paraphotobacterium marinum]|uniref:Ubiquinone biosynthesis O-methyltransferase n=1 Tax=Paraphotobacterium marinum TaxID=1755811 RepID=A0A220VE88_9GAMM|nr:bifunctional 2-polyprenyl-6-hydroxyphenol methylase/3-demethylubiquinol 3-O-methyltransferase UbiG [Paraphotobacterium marinum]ASK78610.1 bifunctional 3-demethylubiquinol 3-O-methyltransferase/2-polyprenyl-6-hydroxyphenol methylase [Paraphotobacterium marinum]
MNNNIDNTELDKFNNIANEWWDLNGKFKPLHEMNPIRLDFITEQCSGIFGKEILDIGCGGGILSEALAKEGAKVTGLDPALASINIAKEHAYASNLDISYKHLTIEEFANESQKKYDIITCLEMLEHVPDPSSIIKSCAKLIKPNGHIFLSTLNRNMKSYLLAILAAEKIFKIVPNGTHDFKKFLKPSDIMEILDNTKFEEQRIAGILFNPLTYKFSLSNNNVDVNYILHAKFID